jgi:hypothetical protein
VRATPSAIGTTGDEGATGGEGMIKGAPDVPGVKECCKNPTNLVRREDDRPFTMDQCTVCGLRHYRLTVDLTTLLKGKT